MAVEAETEGETEECGTQQKSKNAAKGPSGSARYYEERAPVWFYTTRPPELFAARPTGVGQKIFCAN